MTLGSVCTYSPTVLRTFHSLIRYSTLLLNLGHSFVGSIHLLDPFIRYNVHTVTELTSLTTTQPNPTQPNPSKTGETRQKNLTPIQLIPIRNQSIQPNPLTPPGHFRPQSVPRSPSVPIHPSPSQFLNCCKCCCSECVSVCECTESLYPFKSSLTSRLGPPHSPILFFS